MVVSPPSQFCLRTLFLKKRLSIMKNSQLSVIHARSVHLCSAIPIFALGTSRFSVADKLQLSEKKHTGSVLLCPNFCHGHSKWDRDKVTKQMNSQILGHMQLCCQSLLIVRNLAHLVAQRLSLSRKGAVSLVIHQLKWSSNMD